MYLKKKRKHTFILSDLQSDIIQACLPKINITILQYFDDARNNWNLFSGKFYFLSYIVVAANDRDVLFISYRSSDTKKNMYVQFDIISLPFFGISRARLKF